MFKRTLTCDVCKREICKQQYYYMETWYNRADGLPREFDESMPSEVCVSCASKIANGIKEICKKYS